MLRSNHLQPGINLNPISFPSADLTLKVFEIQSHVHRAISLYLCNYGGIICVILCNPFFSLEKYSVTQILNATFFRWNQLARRGRTPSPSLSRALLVEVLRALSLPAALAHQVVSATVLLEGSPCLRCPWHQ